MSTEVEGTAYKVDERSKAQSGLILIPASKEEQERLIQKIVALK